MRNWHSTGITKRDTRWQTDKEEQNTTIQIQLNVTMNSATHKAIRVATNSSYVTYICVHFHTYTELAWKSSTAPYELSCQDLLLPQLAPYELLALWWRDIPEDFVPVLISSDIPRRALQLTFGCTSSCDNESCISTSNCSSLPHKTVSLQPGVITESKLTAETSALPKGNGGIGVGKSNGGICFGAPRGK
jgi:hypothetical protein